MLTFKRRQERCVGLSRLSLTSRMMITKNHCNLNEKCMSFWADLINEYLQVNNFAGEILQLVMLWVLTWHLK